MNLSGLVCSMIGEQFRRDAGIGGSMDRRESAALDRHITGNYGEDFFAEDAEVVPEPEESEPEESEDSGYHPLNCDCDLCYAARIA